MRLSTPRLLLVCLALTGAVGHAGAAALRHMAPEAAPAAESPSGPSDRLEDADIDGAVAAAHAQRPQKAKPQAAPAATTRTSGGDNRMLPARFHSFLPGMFR